jgi:CRP/FNR family transcriptional regulator, polysaccharide utilization system transcription regulator
MIAPSCSTCKNKNALFCGLKDTEKEQFSQNKNYYSYKKGEVIFYEGKRARGLYCIYQGSVKLSKIGDEGRDVIIDLASKGDVLGYSALLTNDSYNASAIAIEDCQICKISQKVFLGSLAKNHVLSLNTIHLLSGDVKQHEVNIVVKSSAAVKERIAQALLLIKEKLGTEKDNQTLVSSLTRREIGEIAGTTTESSIRSLAKLAEDGIIQLKGKKIVIVNIRALEEIANLIH